METKKETALVVEGMTCGHCVKSVRQALTAVAGVTDADVELDRGHARVVHASTTALGSLIAAVEAAGYTAHLEA